MSLKGETKVTIQGTAQEILVVDDDVYIRLMLEQILKADGHQVILASNGREALDRVAQHPPDLVLLDLDMPYIQGYEVCSQIKENPDTRFIPVVILTGQGASDAKLRAWEMGADDFLIKPPQVVEVRARCRALLRVKRLTDDLDSAQSVVFAFARAVEAKSAYTQGHAERVTGYALALAAQIGLPESEWDVLRQGSLLHDIGKISIPDAILNKPGPLTPEEYAVVKLHPAEGARIVEPLRSIRDTIPLIRWHHERLDGQGYPDGLFGGAIPLPVRILAVADVYDALCSDRPYRPAMPLDQCLELLRQNASGGGLDLELVLCFEKAVVEPLLGSAVPVRLGQGPSA